MRSQQSEELFLWERAEDLNEAHGGKQRFALSHLLLFHMSNTISHLLKVSEKKESHTGFQPCHGEWITDNICISDISNVLNLFSNWGGLSIVQYYLKYMKNYFFSDFFWRGCIPLTVQSKIYMRSICMWRHILGPDTQLCCTAQFLFLYEKKRWC